MITQMDIEKMLVDSFEDQRLSSDERVELRELIEELADQPELQSFTRNKAFSIAKNSAENGLIEIASLNWLDKVVKTLDNTGKSAPIRTQAAFSPGDDCRSLIQQEIKRSQKSIDICVFTITDQPLRDAILAAHKRGIKVRILTDQDKANDLGSDIDYLMHKGVDVLLDTSPWHMHHKFALFDGVRLLNGSFNWTRSASDRNQENLTLTDNQEIVSAFAAEFEALWTRHSSVRVEREPA
ncbi:phospholipase D-like domain-containing protein [Neptuniibacter sp. SY11_33]|uniref:phospholipase D-like domain-containing protein n=1 Tax=unclassified Neptuniibacter TaxID=2630693 RepID=UPI0039F58BA0